MKHQLYFGTQILLVQLFFLKSVKNGKIDQMLSELTLCLVWRRNLVRRSESASGSDSLSKQLRVHSPFYLWRCCLHRSLDGCVKVAAHLQVLILFSQTTFSSLRLSPLLTSSTPASQVALVVKNLPANVGDLRDLGSIPGSERFPEEGHGNPLQYSWLENPMDKGNWRAMGHRVAESETTETT